jgi:hypothetical protein
MPFAYRISTAVQYFTVGCLSLCGNGLKLNNAVQYSRSSKNFSGNWLGFVLHYNQLLLRYISTDDLFAMSSSLLTA